MVIGTIIGTTDLIAIGANGLDLLAPIALLYKLYDPFANWRQKGHIVWKGAIGAIGKK